jgi:hypothetical protein
MDVFASYERAGRALSELIEPGSKIYWEGRIPAIFLYLPNVKVYGPQLNHLHYYFNGGDAETLLRFNYWNDELARQWLAEADYILVQNTEKVYLTDEMLESGQYKMFAPGVRRWQPALRNNARTPDSDRLSSSEDTRNLRDDPLLQRALRNSVTLQQQHGLGGVRRPKFLLRLLGDSRYGLLTTP